MRLLCFKNDNSTPPPPSTPRSVLIPSIKITSQIFQNSQKYYFWPRDNLGWPRGLFSLHHWGLLSVCLSAFKIKLHLYRNPFYFHCGKFCANDLISKNYSISPRAQAQDIVPLGAHPSNRAHLFERNITAPPPLLLKSLHSGYEC